MLGAPGDGPFSCLRFPGFRPFLPPDHRPAEECSSSVYPVPEQNSYPRAFTGLAQRANTYQVAHESCCGFEESG